MVKAVRMALYQLGVLEGGAQALRYWSGGFDELDALTAELQAQARRMQPAPKLLLQVTPLPLSLPV